MLFVVLEAFLHSGEGEGVGVGLLLSMLVLFYCATALLATTTAEAGSSSFVSVIMALKIEHGLLGIDYFCIFDFVSLEFGVGGKGVGFHEFARWVHVAMLRGEIVERGITVG
jgi:hypothetical protein